MKRTLFTLGTAVSIAAVTTQMAPASAQSLEESQSSSLSSISSDSENGSSTGALPIIVAATALGGGTIWAVQQGLLPNPLPGIIPVQTSAAPTPASVRGDCSPQAINDALWEWHGSERTMVESCDGHFGFASQNGTDWRVLFEFDGQRWNVSKPAGITKTGLTQGCYNGIELRNRGASEDLLGQIPICTPDEIGNSLY
ncbi:hypothetical protein ACMG4H_01135 [Corynebacterium glutamicum]|uniref:hypothetical protein n=1 Tax=Corynebacterium glutamicum TaxID=1718 RepID=UPI003C7DAB56